MTLLQEELLTVMMISFDGFATVAMPMIVSVFSAVWSMLAPVLLAEQILFVDQTKLYIQSPIFFVPFRLVCGN